MDKSEAIERLEYLRAKAQLALEQEVSEWIAEDVLGTIEAYDMAIEALQTEPNSSEKPNNCEPQYKQCFNCKYEESDERCGPCSEGYRWYWEPKAEPTISKMEQVDEPSGYCNECKWYGDKQVCGRCRSRNLYAPKTEPQTEIKGSKRLLKGSDEPQQKSCATCKHALGNWDGESNNCGRCCGADRRFYEPKDEPQTESTGSPIGDYRDGVGAWQKERSE